MVQGASGRVVVEIEPHLKRQLYSTLAAQGMTLKQWFIRCTELEIERHAIADKSSGKNSKK